MSKATNGVAHEVQTQAPVIFGGDIHAVNNRRILAALRHRFGADDAAVNDWRGTGIVAGIDEDCAKLDAFRLAAAGRQPDAAG